MGKIFCPLASNNIEIKTGGEFSPCCIAYKNFKVGDKVANAATNTIAEVIDSPDRKEWIENFDKNYETDCTHCYEIERGGGRSKRQMEIDLWDHTFTYQPDMLQSLDLKMANVCNLACAICSPYASSKWGSVHKSLGLDYVKTQKWPEKKEFWEGLNNVVDNVRRIELAGGEPFMIKNQEILIKFLIEKGFAKDTEITWFTNCTIWPENLIPYFKEFKQIRIMLSIDNTHEQFEYLRWPAKWDTTYELFLRFKQLAIDGIAQVEISHSVTGINIWHLPNFHAWCREHEVKMYNNFVLMPLNIRDLPQEFKETVKKKFSNHTDPSYQINPVTGVDNWLIRYMMEEGNVENTRKNLERINRSRPGLFDIAFPELKGMFDE